MASHPAIVQRTEITEDARVDRDLAGGAARLALSRLCAAGFVAYGNYAICRTPLLPLFARELGAGPSLIGFVMGASTLTGIAPPGKRGTWLSAYSTVQGAGQALGPVLAGYLIARRPIRSRVRRGRSHRPGGATHRGW